MTDTETRNPFTSRGFIFGAVIVGILLLAAIIITITSQSGGERSVTPLTATPTPTTAATPTADPAAASVCGLQGYDETGSLESPPAADWTIVGTMAAPSSDAFGPGSTDGDGLRSCYSHTVEGATFASLNLWAMGSNARLSAAVLEHLVAPGPGRDIAMETDYGSSSEGTSAQIVGFKVLSYTGSSATIDTAFRLNTGALASAAQDLQWVDGDWKLVLTDDGKPPYQPVMLQSLGGYIAWAGVE